ncbi:MAG: hypothetical protein LUH54_03870, partial [Firmicutes bacterium]|nr:hypothetical protein [Bacillota bacterium]
MPEKLNSFLSRDRRRTYIVIALAELILSAAVFFAVRFVFESLFYYLSYVGKILRVMAADIIAWTVSLTAAYPFYKKYVFGADNDADGEKLSCFLGLSAASSIAEILILLFATCVLSCRGLIGKLFGTAFSSLCHLIIGCLTLREDDIPHLPEKIKSALFTNPRQYKKIKSPLFRTLLRTAGYVALAVTPFFCAVMLEMFNYAGITRFTSFLDKHPGSFLLSVTVLYLIFAVLLLILKRGGVAAALMIAVSVAAGIANYLKYSLTGDYFYPWDLVNQSGNIGELLSFVSSGIPAALILLIIVGALIAVTAFASRSDLPVKAYIRIPAAALIVLSM